MLRHSLMRPGMILALVSAWSVGSPPTTLAAPPAGITITGTANCVNREGGYRGYRVDAEYQWSYDASANLGPVLTVGGTYYLYLHNPTTGEYVNVYAKPYGLALYPDSAEKRAERSSPSAPHWVFDHVLLVVDWTIQETGESGSETQTVGCAIDAPPEGQEIITAPASEEPTSETAAGQGGETFVSTADPSPYSSLMVDSSLYCQWQGGKRRYLANWALTSNLTRGSSDGMTVSGVVRFYTRTNASDYSLVAETPFALFMQPTEARDISGFVEGGDFAAAKLEVEWRASFGSQVDPGASIQHILRTTACSK